MSKLFLHIYDYFDKHHIALWTLMIGSFLLMVVFAVQVKFEEDVTRFFPKTKDSKTTETVFSNLKIKDKLLVMVTARDTTAEVNPDSLIEAGDKLKEELWKAEGGKTILSILSGSDAADVNGMTDFIYAHLPLYLTEADYQRIDTLLTEKGMSERMESNYLNLISPAGGSVSRYISRDPMGIGTPFLAQLSKLGLSSGYTLYNGHLFSENMKALLLVITPRYGTGSTGKNEKLVSSIEKNLKNCMEEHSSLHAVYFGGPSVSVGNARQIKADTMLTLSIALLIIIIAISLSFKSHKAVPLILIPVIYGAAFALALIYFIKGSVSSIAIGAGAAVFGVALSYSIHVLSHFNHVGDIRQTIKDLAYPLTVGSFTTVGAFFGLVFTTSGLLSDFGLFSSLALIGTTLYCLVFMPHLLHRKETGESGGRLLHFIERFNGYAFDRNKPLIVSLGIIFIVCIFLSGKVKFDSNMMNLNYETPELKAAEAEMNRFFPSDKRSTPFVSTGVDESEALQNYRNTNRELERLKSKGAVKEYASASFLLVPTNEQRLRIARWQTYWTPARIQRAERLLFTEGSRYSFRPGSFDGFHKMVTRNYDVTDFSTDTTTSKLLSDWVTKAGGLCMFVTQVRMDEKDKPAVYKQMETKDGPVIFDRAFFTNKWVAAVNNDFYLILYISSLLVFFALLLSYGRMELTLMVFAPMAVSWIIILGLMALFGIEFNIVNIILATFIFGLGDDFSIFIMDGLQQEYRTGKKMLASHKTAIFFSSFTAVVGLGALVFARHPALRSISLLAIPGMISVVLVAYTLLPVLFRFFISGPAAKGRYPYTMRSLIDTIWFYSLFATGCALMLTYVTILFPLPLKKEKKKQLFGKAMARLFRFLLNHNGKARIITDNLEQEDFKKPCVMVANHQSFVDIVLMLSLSPKLVMVTNAWVWKSPIFGRIVRYADFLPTSEGHDALIERLRPKVAEGYSVIVFPEGTRSADGTIRRFHRGAFYIAEKLHLDILPIVLYGTGMVINKRQPTYISKGILCRKILKRIPMDSNLTGRHQAHAVEMLVRKVYDEMCQTYATTENPWFAHRLLSNYIYKGPVEEWYTRIKTKMEGYYTNFHKLIPLEAQITDLGCGMGAMDFMLALLSGKRRILGIDYDEEKIALAAHSYIRNEQLTFVCSDALSSDLPQSDVFIISDMLHYLPYDKQEQLLDKCLSLLNDNGMIVVRDSDAEKIKNQRVTKLTEIWSTQIIGFNKRTNDLCFPSLSLFNAFAMKNGLRLETQANDAYTSNTIYVLRKEGGCHV